MLPGCGVSSGARWLVIRYNLIACNVSECLALLWVCLEHIICKGKSAALWKAGCSPPFLPLWKRLLIAHLVPLIHKLSNRSCMFMLKNVTVAVNWALSFRPSKTWRSLFLYYNIVQWKGRMIACGSSCCPEAPSVVAFGVVPSSAPPVSGGLNSYSCVTYTHGNGCQNHSSCKRVITPYDVFGCIFLLKS